MNVIIDGQFTITTKEETPCIYAIFNNENRRVYVGESKTPMIRYRQHITGLRTGTHANKELQSDFNKGHNFTFYRLMRYGDDEIESMRYHELRCMYTCRKEGYKLYNSETDKQIIELLKFNSYDWKIFCLMENKRNEYYKKYFGCTYYQFITYYDMDKRKGQNSYMRYKIEWFNKKRKEEIEKEQKDKRKQFLRENKKISFYIKKDIYEKIKEISDNPEEYINNIIEKSVLDLEQKT